MHVNDQMLPLAVVILVALITGAALARLRQPALVGYLLTGLILGPGGFALVETREYVSFLADLGVLLLLFFVGMELSLRGFRAIWKIAVATAVLQGAIAVFLMWLLSHVFGWTPGAAVLLGFVIALSSTAVAIKMLEDMNLLRTQLGQLTVAVLIAQDLAIIPMMLILGHIAGDGDASAWAGIGKVAASALVLAALVAILSRRAKLNLPFAKAVAKSPELRPLYGTAICFGAATMTGLLGLSTVYGAFLAGLVVGNSRMRGVILRGVQPLQNLLVMVFFVSIGLMIDMTFVADHFVEVFLILLIITVGKSAVNIGILMILREPWPHALISGLMLAQVGEFSFVLGAMGRRLDLISADEFQLVITVTAFSLIISPLWLVTARRLLRIALTRTGDIKSVYQMFRSGGWQAFWRAAHGRQLPPELTYRLFGKPRLTINPQQGGWRSRIIPPSEPEPELEPDESDSAPDQSDAASEPESDSRKADI
jgi:monovalent cation:H+ antiporter-2, CPA2 family